MKRAYSGNAILSTLALRSTLDALTVRSSAASNTMNKRVPLRGLFMFRLPLAALFFFLMLSVSSTRALAASPTFYLSCSRENDLFVLLQRSGLKPRRYETPEKTISAAPRGSAVLLLAD